MAIYVTQNALDVLHSFIALKNTENFGNMLIGYMIQSIKKCFQKLSFKCFKILVERAIYRLSEHLKSENFLKYLSESCMQGIRVERIVMMHGIAGL
jgi:hypothetical protein